MKLLNQLLLAILGMVFLTGCKESTSILSLAGEWEFAIDTRRGSGAYQTKHAPLRQTAAHLVPPRPGNLLDPTRRH